MEEDSSAKPNVELLVYQLSWLTLGTALHVVTAAVSGKFPAIDSTPSLDLRYAVYVVDLGNPH